MYLKERYETGARVITKKPNVNGTSIKHYTQVMSGKKVRDTQGNVSEAMLLIPFGTILPVLEKVTTNDVNLKGEPYTTDIIRYDSSNWVYRIQVEKVHPKVAPIIKVKPMISAIGSDFE